MINDDHYKEMKMRNDRQVYFEGGFMVNRRSWNKVEIKAMNLVLAYTVWIVIPISMLAIIIEIVT